MNRNLLLLLLMTLLHPFAFVAGQDATIKAGAQAPPNQPRFKAQNQYGLRYVTGRVLGDADSRPLAGIRVQLSAGENSKTLTTDASGGYSGYINGLPIVVRVEDARFVSMERQQPQIVGSWQVPDLRLTPRATPVSLPATLLGVGFELQPTASTITITPFSAQALPALLPPGYSPVFGFEVQGLISAAQLKVQAPGLRSPGAGASWELLRREGHGWRLDAQAPVISPFFTFSAATNGSYLLAYRDPAQAPAAIGTLLERLEDVLVPAVNLGQALANPSVVSILETPLTQFHLSLDAAGTASGARAVVALRERHESIDGPLSLPEERLDLYCYAYGSGTPGSLAAKIGVMTRKDIDLDRTLSAHIAFEATSLRYPDFQVPENGELGRGPLSFDFDDAMEDPLAVAVRDAPSADLPLIAGASLRSCFELEVGGTLLGQVGLSYRGPESAALVLLRRLDYGAWAYAGAMRLEEGLWRLDREHADFDQGGVYALVALPRPVREFAGQVRAGASPIAAARVSLSAHPWLGLSHANGEYRHFAEPVPSGTSLPARAFDPQGYRSASREIALGSGESTLLGQDFAITGSDFQLVSYEPSADTSFVPLLPEISLVFNLPVTGNSMIYGNEVQLVDLAQPQTPLEIHVSREHNILRILPQASLKALSEYEVRVRSGLLDLNGIPCNPASFRFHTRADEPSSDLDLRRFFLSLENEALYLNAPKDAYPDRTYLTVLNMDSAFSEAYSLSSAHDFKTLVRGVPGDLFELTANKPDGTIQTHKLDLVKLGPDLYRLGKGGFTLDLGPNGALIVDKVTSGSGTPVTIRAIEAQVIQDRAFSTPALRDPDHPDQPAPMNVHLSFEILAAPGVVPPSFVGQLAFKAQEPTTSTHFGAFSLFEQDMPEALGSQVLKKTPLVQVLGDLVHHPDEAAKNRKKFVLLTFMMNLFFNPTAPTGIYCGVINYPGRQPDNNFLNVRSHRSPTDHIPLPNTTPPSWFNPESQIHVPYTPIWLTHLGGGTSMDPRNAVGVMPLGYTDASGNLKTFFNGHLRRITGTDPHTGQISLGSLRSNFAVVAPSGELISYTFNEDVHFEWRDSDSQTPPKASWSWVLLSPVGENDWEILKDESAKANQSREIHVSDHLRLGIKVELLDVPLAEVTLYGSTQNATIFQQTDHSRIMILPESLLLYPSPLDYKVTAYTPNGTSAQMRATLSVLDDSPPADVPGNPFLIYAPEGGPFSISQSSLIRFSESVKGWYSGISLVEEETNRDIPLYLVGDDGISITSDSIYTRIARVYPAQALRFSHKYRFHIKGLTDLNGNSMIYHPPAEQGATEIQTQIHTLIGPEEPEPFFPDSRTRWSVAHYRNITVFLDYSDMISRKIFFHIYDMANPKKPKLLRVLESKMPPQITAHFAIISPEELGPDEIGLYPNFMTGQIGDLQPGTFFILAGHNAAIGHDTGKPIINNMLVYRYKEVESNLYNDASDELAYEAEFLGRFGIQETGMIQQLVKIGAYLAIAFDDWFSPQASTLVYDMRILLGEVLHAVDNYNRGLLTLMEFPGALAAAASVSSTRFPHPTDPQGIDLLFRYSEDHVFRPTLLIAGAEFPGIYDFEPGSTPLPTGPPIDTLPYTDQRYLGITSWNGVEQPHGSRSVGSVSQMEYWNSRLSEFKRGDFALFSVSTRESSQIFIYEIPKEPLGRPEEQLLPIIKMNFHFHIKLMSVDSITGLVALMDPEGLLSVFDLRRVLETRTTDRLETYSVNNYNDPIFILPEPLKVYFSTFMEFENGIVYGTSPGHFETYFIPIDLREFKQGQIQFDVVPNELGQKSLAVPFADSLENEQLELDECESGLGEEENPEQPEPRPVPLKLNFVAPTNEIIDGTFEIKAELNGDIFRVYKKANPEDPGQVLELPQTYHFEVLPRQIWLWGLQAGEAWISISYFSREGQLVSKDYLKLNISRWLEGPGVVSGDDYIGNYELAIEDALESDGPCGEEIKREFGFKLNRDAQVSLKLGGKTIYAMEHLKAGVYNKPIELKVGKTPWEIQVVYPDGDGEITDEGTIEITQGWEDKLGVGSTAFKGVNLTSGVLTTGTVDIDIPNGFGLGLTFNRNYASTVDQDYSPLGIGWSHNYQTRLIRGECGGLVVVGGEDSGKSYDENTGLPHRPGVFSHLERNNRRGYTLVTKSQMRWVYGEPLPPGSIGSTDPLLFQSNLLEIVDPFGNKTSFSYNPDNKQLEKITDPAGRALVFTYSKGGLYPLLQKITTENVEPAITVNYEHDSYFRLTKVSRGARSDKYQYAEPCLPKGEANLLIAYKDSLDAETRYEYDNENRIVAIHEPEEISYGLSYQVSPSERKTLIRDAFAVTTYEFDLYSGNLIKVEGPLGTKTMEWDNESGNLLREVDEMGFESLFEYDERGNMTKRTSPMGVVETWEYHPKWNRPIRFTNALGGVKTWIIDEQSGQVTEETNAEGFRTSYNYDSKGLMTSTTDARGNQTQFKYDSYGYQTAIVQADGNVRASTFDSRGRLLSLRDASGGVLANTYNDLDQVIEERLDALQSGGKHNEYLEILPTGHVTRHRMGKVLTIRVFDQQYREIHREVTPGQGLASIVTDYVYDAKSNLIRESIRGEGGSRVFEREYDAAGRLTLVKLNGNLYNKLTYESGSYQPSSIQDYSGAITSFEYDDFGRQIKQRFHTGPFTEIEYDKRGNALRETDVNGFATLYSYDKLDRVITVTNPLGEVIHYGYDGNGNQVSKYEEALGNRVTNSYDNMNRPQTSRIQNDDLDQSSSYQYHFGGGKNYSSFQPPLGAAIETHYNALGQAISRRQNGIEVGYTYDANGNLEAVNYPGGFRISQRHDGIGQLLHESSPNGEETYYRYDFLGRLVQVTEDDGTQTDLSYDDYDNLTRIVKRRGSETYSESWTYSYADGVTTKTHTDHRGNQTIEITDALSRTLRLHDDARNAESTFDWNGSQLMSITDPLGHQRHFQYDPLGRLLKVDEQGIHSTQFSYLRGGRTQTMIDPNGVEWGLDFDGTGKLRRQYQRDQLIYQFEYDQNNRLIRTQDAEGITTLFTYDAVGNRISQQTGSDRIEWSEIDAFGNPRLVTHGELSKRFEYDFYGNLLRESNGAGETTRYQYNTKQLLVSKWSKDSKGVEVETSYEYDLFDNLKKITEPGGLVTSFNWDPSWSQLSITDPGGTVSTRELDRAGRLVNYSYPGAGTTHFEYNPLDQPIRVQFGTGSVTHSYDPLGRPIREDWSGNADATAAIHSVQRVYDNNHNLLSVTQDGSEGLYTRSISYDSFNRPKRISDSRGLSYELGYYLNGSRKYIRNALGNETGYQYDSANRLQRVALPGGAFVDYQFRPSGLLEQITHGNGVRAQYDYDAAGRPTSLVFTRPDGLSRFNTSYYPSGLRASYSEDRGALGIRNTQYQYDSAGRLTGWTRTTPSGERTTSLTLDGAGNRLSELETGAGYQRSRTYQVESNRVASFRESLTRDNLAPETREVVFGYDSNGNRLSKTETHLESGTSSQTQMVWDARKRMRKILRDGTALLAFEFDDLDRRIVKLGDQRDSAPIHYLWDELAPLHEFTSGAGALQARSSYYYGHSLLAMDQVGAERQWVGEDVLGSLVEQTSDAGLLLVAQSYDPFGQAEKLYQSPASDWMRLGFTGHELDPESGLIYAKARFYDADLGLFTSTDPELGNGFTPPSLHRYLYGNGNPLAFVDPTGRSSEESGETEEKDERGLLKKAFDWVVDKGSDLMLAGKDYYDEVKSRNDANPDPDKPSLLADLVISNPISTTYLQREGEPWEERPAPSMTSNPLFAPIAPVLEAVEKVDQIKDGLNDINRAVQNGDNKGAAQIAKKMLEDVAVDLVMEVAPTALEFGGKAMKAAARKLSDIPQQTTRALKKVQDEVKIVRESFRSSGTIQEGFDRRTAIKSARKETNRAVKHQKLVDGGFTGEEANSLIQRGVVCFVAGTMVVTAEGAKPIEQVQLGDLVLSRDENGGFLGLNPVIALFTTHPETLYQLVYQDESGQEHQLSTTAEHPFYVVEQDAWVRAADLKLGDRFETAKGKTAELVRMEIQRGPPGTSFTTYNFTVEEHHTYFVAPVGTAAELAQKVAVWVHNAGKKPCGKNGPGKPTNDSRKISSSPDQPVVTQVRSAKEVNDAMIESNFDPAWGGTTVTTEVVPAGTRFSMVVSKGQADALLQGKSAFGGWATPDKIPSQEFARNNLAILPKFKPDVSLMVVVEATAPQRLNRGVVGPLDPYPGGANQVEFLGERFLKLVDGPHNLPLLSPGD